MLIRRFYSTSKPLKLVPPSIPTLSTPQDMSLAREWISQFSRLDPQSDWPSHLYTTSFTRSSGPGGQHVNRTLSKATLRFYLPCQEFLPQYFIKPHLYRSSNYASKPSSLLISSSETRSQHSNLSRCFERMKQTILEAAKRDLVGETTKEQEEKVVGLIKREKRKVEKVKKMRKEVKSGRGKVKGWE